MTCLGYEAEKQMNVWSGSLALQLKTKVYYWQKSWVTKLKQVPRNPSEDERNQFCELGCVGLRPRHFYHSQCQIAIFSSKLSTGAKFYMQACNACSYRFIFGCSKTSINWLTRWATQHAYLRIVSRVGPDTRLSLSTSARRSTHWPYWFSISK